MTPLGTMPLDLAPLGTATPDLASGRLLAVPSEAVSGGRRALLVDLCLGLTLAFLWASGHGIVGIEGDSRIYMGRALADLDPAGVGRDMMFAMDGQSSFSVFRLLARGAAAALGLGPTVVLFSIAALAAWFAAIVAFARSVVPGRALVLALAAVCVLPRLYTPWNLLAAGEAIPVPRPFAEAGVLLALAALAQGRTALCAASLIAAALFHPIMAAPGFGILLITLGLRDRRWFAGAALLGLGCGLAGALGLPVASRLMVTIDPDWQALLLERNPYLFVHLWPLADFGRFAVQAVTILMAGVWLEARIRIIFYAALAIAGLGCLASVLLGDVVADLLIVQAQLWRALWLPAVLAPVAAGVCLWRLPSRGLGGRIALAFLCLAWMTLDMPATSVPAALAAAAALFAVPRLFPAGTPTLVGAWIIFILLAAVSQWNALLVLGTLVARAPPHVPVALTSARALGLYVMPVMLLAYAAWRWPAISAARVAAALALAAALGVMIATQDVRTDAHRDADAALVKTDLTAMLAARPGEVLWLGGDDVWYWTRRPNWNGQTQGGGIVFSRDLAMQWRRRTQAMVEDGLATDYFLDTWRQEAPMTLITLDRMKVEHFCRAADAPAWIVAPLEGTRAVPAGLAATIWSPPRAHWKMVVGADDVRWHHLERYAVVPCAKMT